MTDETPYDRRFWLCYASNFSFQAMVALLFRYADFVTAAGGDERWDLGWIVGIGMIGSLSMRSVQGVAIDRFGTRPIWLSSIVLILVSLAGHLAITSVHGPAVYVLRILYMTGLAGAYGASITFTFLRSKPQLMAEAVGTLGTAGFLGLIVGSYLSDWLCPEQQVSRESVNGLFLAAGGFMLFALVVSWFATLGEQPPRPRRRPSMWAVLRRYHPGTLLFMSAVMGFGIALPYTFLRPYLKELGINGLGLFFTVYAVTAFVSRLTVRGWPQRFGNRPMILAGMGFLILSVLLYLTVLEKVMWPLLFPALAAGVAHAVLFPAIVAGGSGSFPHRYRGLGTSLMLAMFDVGMFVGMPAVGGLLRGASYLGMPAFPTMFALVAAALTLATGFFAWRARPAAADAISQPPSLNT